ncbi:MAG: 4'-phosphopantetheinyl transferase superfamily protein [Acidimicrobiaceae bacterium]|nr:4'-phosphopantetheinyl transferase superfamily protein [Acidimicrobiaceae bacterium]
MNDDPLRWWSPFTDSGDVSVIHVDLVPHQRRETEAVAWLDAHERSRWQSYRSSAAQRRYGLCRAALRAVLCGRIGCPNNSLAFIPVEGGKPFALVDDVPVSISFNVSHSGNHGLIAVASSGRVGVDVEERVPRRKLENLIEGVFSPQEQAELTSLDGYRRLHMFFRFWTIKEALVKAWGKGLFADVAALEIPRDMRRGAPRSVGRFAQISETYWCLEDIGSKDFAAAVAYESKSAQP